MIGSLLVCLKMFKRFYGLLLYKLPKFFCSFSQNASNLILVSAAKSIMKINNWTTISTLFDTKKNVGSRLLDKWIDKVKSDLRTWFIILDRCVRASGSCDFFWHFLAQLAPPAGYHNRRFIPAFKPLTIQDVFFIIFSWECFNLLSQFNYSPRKTFFISLVYLTFNLF